MPSSPSRRRALRRRRRRADHGTRGGEDMPDVLLGVDIGTSSTKGVITHADGTVLATAQRTHKTEFPRPGFVEHDPEGMWWKDFSEITKELLPQADGPVVGVSVSGIGATTLPADANGEPLRHAILY